MILKTINFLTTGAIFLGIAAEAGAHGLMVEPPSRNAYCGLITKPYEVHNGTAEYPVCGDAFAFDENGSYNFMSVLTHTRGRAVVTPLPDNVCGFDAETWNGGATPWDQPIDWPTSAIAGGDKTITWNISWGPHFDDTEEFRYWITKSDFVFQAGVPLAWSDFEDQAFCVLTYDDTDPTGNPHVVADKPGSLFHTTCTVPPRQGRHVIYGEWGRNYFTYERFHGCIDVVFDTTGPIVEARITTDPEGPEFTGAGTMALDGSGSQGDDLAFQWSVTSHNPDLYDLVDPAAALTQLALAEPQAAGAVTIMLSVSNSQGGADTASVSFTHLPTVPSQWHDLGVLTAQPRTLEIDDRVFLRTVNDSGQDAFWPAPPLVIDAQTTAPEAWPLALAEAVNVMAGAVRVGVLSDQDEVIPQAHASNNRVYALLTSRIVSVFLQVEASTGDCTCAAGCATRELIAPEFVFAGAGTFCWEATSLGNFINSWNLASLAINGVDLTNRWVSANNLPDRINGKYFVSYVGQYPWSHFEARN